MNYDIYEKIEDLYKLGEVAYFKYTKRWEEMKRLLPTPFKYGHAQKHTLTSKVITRRVNLTLP